MPSKIEGCSTIASLSEEIGIRAKLLLMRAEIVKKQDRFPRRTLPLTEVQPHIIITNHALAFTIRK
ncbi:MAG: hypothetical protein ABJO09_11410 [Hyphomicrobiales bacterium]